MNFVLRIEALSLFRKFIPLNPMFHVMLRTDLFLISIFILCELPVADPGFFRDGETSEGAPTCYLANFSQKLHEHEEILAGGYTFLAPP